MNEEAGYYAANSIEGVFKIDIADYYDHDVMTPRDFYEALDTCDEETIITAIDHTDLDILKKISDEYGLR